MQVQLQNRNIELDSVQIVIYKKLKSLSNFLERTQEKGNLLCKLSSLIKPKKTCQSLYIYGDVGRGKSMLVKYFYTNLKIKQKSHFHFNYFMKTIHENLRDIRKEKKTYKDELVEAIKRLVKKNILLSIDEFQVLDIADAMLLDRIFSYIFANNILVIFTSNTSPQDLYKNGLQRQLFLEFIENTLIKKCQILNLNGPIDYRMLYSQNINQLFFLNTSENNSKLLEIISILSKGAEPMPLELEFWERKLLVKKTYKDIAIFDFKELCLENLSSIDYFEICKNFNLIILLNIPKLTKEHSNEIRRFTLFIDEVYENHTALILSAATTIANIYLNRKVGDAFNRTVSRLEEITSDQYWKNSKFIKK